MSYSTQYLSHPIIAFSDIKLHSKQSESELKLFEDDENARFGILTIKTEITKQSKRPIYLVIDMDGSGSMEENTGTKTKLAFVQQTLTCMFQFISEQTDAEIYISVNKFDDHYENIIPTTRISLSNFKDMIDKINSIDAYGSTNIEKTLKKSKESIQIYKEQNPTHKIVYILLFDGQTTTENSKST